MPVAPPSTKLWQAPVTPDIAKCLQQVGRGGNCPWRGSLPWGFHLSAGYQALSVPIFLPYSAHVNLCSPAPLCPFSLFFLGICPSKLQTQIMTNTYLFYLRSACFWGKLHNHPDWFMQSCGPHATSASPPASPFLDFTPQEHPHSTYTVLQLVALILQCCRRHGSWNLDKAWAHAAFSHLPFPSWPLLFASAFLCYVTHDFHNCLQRGRHLYINFTKEQTKIQRGNNQGYN